MVKFDDSNKLAKMHKTENTSLGGKGERIREWIR